MTDPTPVATHSHVGPRVVGAGLAMVAVAYVGYDADRPHLQAAGPSHPPSVAPSSPEAKPKPTKTGRPDGGTKPKPRRVPDGVRVVAVAAPRTSTGGGTSRHSPGKPAPSGPAPRPPTAPTPPTQATARCDVGLAVLALNACLNLGGSR